MTEKKNYKHNIQLTDRKKPLNRSNLFVKLLKLVKEIHVQKGWYLSTQMQSQLIKT
jgi:hypothetical protein